MKRKQIKAQDTELTKRSKACDDELPNQSTKDRALTRKSKTHDTKLKKQSQGLDNEITKWRISDENELQENQLFSDAEMDSTLFPNTIEESSIANENAHKTKKKGRGRSKLKMPTVGKPPIKLEWNEYGKPIGEASVKYSSFLGSLAREFVPYTLDCWDSRGEEVEDKMWDILKMKFDVKESDRKAIFQHIDKLWRDGKSKLRIVIRNAHEGNPKSRALSLLKPDTMNQNDWETFVTRTLLPVFLEKSAHFSGLRSNQCNNHTMGRRGYARLTDDMEKKSKGNTKITRVQVWVKAHEKKDGKPSCQLVADKMKEILECPSEAQNTSVIADDAISIVFGKESRGMVRGLGFGVAPSKVGAHIQQNAVVNKLQEEFRTLQHGFDELKSMFLAQASRQPSQLASNRGVVSSGNGIGNEGVSGGGVVNGATSQTNQRTQPLQGVPENTKCKLLHPLGKGVVAEGRIASTDPSAKVHHTPLGRSSWKVWVDKVLMEDVELIRPNDEMFLLEHAIGSTVAWFSNLIILE